MSGIIGKKVKCFYMTSLFNEDGKNISGTVIQMKNVIMCGFTGQNKK